ncbi:MAG TPA: hypothetical protein VKB75_11985 [Jatrophihabitans sp.]|nr:hypothetical protein [Jatrophihabitans sp.]
MADAPDEEVLSYGRHAWRRGVWLILAVVTAVTVSALLAIRATTRPVAGKGFVAPARSETPVPNPSDVVRPWPTAPTACGGQTELPQITSARASVPTGLRLLVANGQVIQFAFDTAQSTPISLHVSGNRLPAQVVKAGSTTYVFVVSCGFSVAIAPELIRISANGAMTRRSMPVDAVGILSDGTRAWVLSAVFDPQGRSRLISLDGGPSVRLPKSFWPQAATGGALLGTMVGSGERVALVDPYTGKVRRRLGDGVAMSAGGGEAVWAVGCNPDNSRPCELHAQAVSGGPITTYPLPRPPGFTAALISNDGRRLAFTLERAGRDPHFSTDHPLPPTDVAELDLHSGRLNVVPDVELSPKSAPGLGFSPDSRWLVIALNGRQNIRVLAWHPGLDRPYESVPVAGPGLVGPSISVLSTSG